jgi:hypothetical protein
MTSEPDDNLPGRPPTIDLTATEVATGRAAGAPAQAGAADAGNEAKTDARSEARSEPRTRASEATPTPPRPRRFRHFATGVLSGAILVVLIGAWLWWVGLVSAPTLGLAAAVASRADNKAIDDLSARLAKVESAAAVPRSDPTLVTRLASAEAATKSVTDALAALAARLATTEAATKSATDALTALGGRIDAAAGAARDARNRADEAAAAADAARRAGQSNLQRGDLDALANRLAALERSVKALGDDVAKRAANADDRAARLIVAAQALRATVEHGDAFAPELAAVKALGADSEALSPLAPFASTGVPSVASLAHDLSALVPAMRKASGAASSEGGIFDRLQANAQKLVRVTPIDAPAGDDAGAVVARIAADAAHADIAGAFAEIAKLPDNVRAVAESWVQKAKARNAAIAASRRIATDALAALAKPAAQ